MEDIIVEPDGTIRFVYSDTLAAAFDGEVLHTIRASHVEPHPTRSGWLADMRPVGGPILGADGAVVGAETAEDTLVAQCALEPFATRQAALDAEREWIRKELGL